MGERMGDPLFLSRSRQPPMSQRGVDSIALADGGGKAGLPKRSGVFVSGVRAWWNRGVLSTAADERVTGVLGGRGEDDAIEGRKSSSADIVRDRMAGLDLGWKSNAESSIAWGGESQLADRAMSSWVQACCRAEG